MRGAEQLSVGIHRHRQRVDLVSWLPFAEDPRWWWFRFTCLFLRVRGPRLELRLRPVIVVVVVVMVSVVLSSS